MKLNRTGSLWDRNQRNDINENWEVIEGFLKGVLGLQDLVFKEKLTSEQYADLLSGINNLIKKGQVSLNDLSPEILEAIDNGDGTPFEILSIPRDKSVTPEKTTFFKSTRNLFKGTYLPYAMLGGSGSASVSTDNPDNRRVAFIEVEPNTEYTIRNHDNNDVNTRRNMRVAESSIHFSDLEFGTNNRATLLNVVKAYASGNSATFTTGSDTNYLYVELSENGFEPRFQVEKGEEATEYTASHVFPVDLLEEDRSVYTSEGENWEVG